MSSCIEKFVSSPCCIGKVPVIAIVAMAAAISGCAPIPTTMRPQSNIHVTDKDGRPIFGATVVVMTSFLAPKDISWEKKTDDNGVASFSRETSPNDASAAATDGNTPLLWMWCVERIGYISVAGSQAGEPQMENVSVRLINGYGGVRCNASERFSEVSSWQERLQNARLSGNIPRSGVNPQRPALEATQVIAGRANAKLRLHVISLANQTAGHKVEVSVADPAAEHVIVLLSHAPVSWKLSISKGTRVQGVLFSSGNTERRNSVVTGLPEGTAAIDVNLPKPIQRYGYDQKFGTIQLREDFIELREKLIGRYGVGITDFQSGISQTSFMIR